MYYRLSIEWARTGSIERLGYYRSLDLCLETLRKRFGLSPIETVPTSADSWDITIGHPSYRVAHIQRTYVID